MLDFKNAIFTPFKPKHLLNLLVIPGVILLIGYQLIFLFYKGLVPGSSYWWWEHHQENIWSLWVLGALSFLFASVFYIFEMGMLFQFMCRCYQDGFEEAESPSWFKEAGSFIKPGLFLYGFKLIISFVIGAFVAAGMFLVGNLVGRNAFMGNLLGTLVSLLALVATVGVMPFLWGCLAHAAQSGDIGGLLNLNNAFALGKTHYKTTFVSLLLSLIVIVLSSVVMGFTFILTLGIVPPFVYVAMITSVVMLFMQAFHE